MHAIYTGLAVWNLTFLLGFLGLGVLREWRGQPEVHVFQLAAVFVALFCCTVQTLLVAHFVGSMKWIQQSGPTAGIEDTKPLRTAWIKGPMFPTVLSSMLLAVAIGILAGAAARGGVPPAVYLGLTLLALPVNVLALRRARAELLRQRARMRDVQARMDRSVAEGRVREEDAKRLLPESGRAGAKVFLFLAANVWLLYAYMRFVLRNPHEPLLPYAIASLLLFLVGTSGVRHYHHVLVTRDGPGRPPPPQPGPGPR